METREKQAQGRATPQIRDEPKPRFAEQHQRAPGLEAALEPRPRYEATRYRAAGKLEGKSALITGGDSGIGRAVAALYAREGADVAISYLPEEQPDADETARAVKGEGRRCLLLPGDLTSPAACTEAVEKTVSQLGKLDILVSNAAYQRRKDTIEDITDEEFDRTFRTDMYAYFFLARAALRHMKPGSAIIATSSMTAIRGSKALLDYSSTKGAINAFTKSLALSAVERGIRVNAVAAGPVWTPLNPSDAGLPPEKVAEFGKSTPLGRPAQPEELAPAYVFLASDADSSFITGIVLQVAGGEIAG
ncbi:MAG TPA: SDR family oxidoreductase [Burkholderiales bacterium]|nr:SDR family oxidoreductase [Burkholderiales bacterium]